MSLSKIVIPKGFPSRKTRSPQTGGSVQTGGTNLMNNKLLLQWMKNNGLSTIKQTTPIPLVTLIAVYNQYTGRPISQLSEIIDPKDLKKYMTLNGITTISAQTRLPFGLIMGPNVFKQLIEEGGLNQGGEAP